MNSMHVPQHFYSKIATISAPRSVFPFVKTDTVTLKSDYLYPNYSLTYIPGDTIKMSYSNLTRFLPAIDVPMMDNVWCTIHFWDIPWRLVWSDTKYFFGEQDRSNDISSYVIPKIEFNEDTGYPVVGSIWDYLGYPIQGTDSQYTQYPKWNALKARSYNLVYDEWYRDEQRCDYAYYNNSSTNDSADDFVLLKRGKRFDMFTSTLLQPQIGEPVRMPLGTVASVYTGEANPSIVGSVTEPLTPISFVRTNGDSWNVSRLTGLTADGTLAYSTSSANVQDATFAPNNLYADLSSATSADIATLRMAFQMQAFQEIRAKSGQRYTEYIYGIYSVISPDARLQRPEYLGGCTFPISVQPVVQQSGSFTTNEGDITTPQGTITAYMAGGVRDKFIFEKSFTEFGTILGIINIYSDLTYFQGIRREDYIDSPLELPIPIFGNLTDEQLDRKQLYYTGDDSVDLKAFGYIERYGWAKSDFNTLRGLVRPNAPQSLGQWSLAQLFASDVANNANFIESNTDMKRLSAVTDEDNFIVNQKFDVTVIRELPQYADTMKWMMRN